MLVGDAIRPSALLCGPEGVFGSSPSSCVMHQLDFVVRAKNVSSRFVICFGYRLQDMVLGVRNDLSRRPS